MLISRNSLAPLVAAYLYYLPALKLELLVPCYIWVYVYRDCKTFHSRRYKGVSTSATKKTPFSKSFCYVTFVRGLTNTRAANNSWDFEKVLRTCCLMKGTEFFSKRGFQLAIFKKIKRLRRFWCNCRSSRSKGF